MKIFLGLFFSFILLLLHAKEINSDQVKVAYTYNFLKHTVWKNESALKEYHLLVVSKNESIKNMFLMLSSRKSLNDKKIRVTFYDPRSIPKNIQAIYVDEESAALYDKLFYEYESDDVLFISDGYKDRKKVMINLTENNNIIAFEINKANILNRSLNISPDLVLLGGTEIDVAKLYKSSQDELKEQKEAITLLSKKISEKNSELSYKIAAIEKQKEALIQQQSKIDLQSTMIANQLHDIAEQSTMIRTQQDELESIRSRIEAQKHQLFEDEKQIREKELILKTLLASHQEKYQEINNANAVLSTLNNEITKQKNNLVHQEGVIASQKTAIGGLLLLSIIIVILSVFIFKQNRRLNELSQIDPLTGLFNRRAFVPKISNEIDQFERYGTQLSILVVDVDHFKTINDTFGHDIGDKVLKEIASLIQTYIRKTDFCVRWGGEEFVILATSTQTDKAMIMAQNLRIAVENHSFGIDHKVTISVGLASLEEGDQVENLIRKADEALYRAKQSGRNKIILG